jgi:hypothetical protein
MCDEPCSGFFRRVEQPRAYIGSKRLVHLELTSQVEMNTPGIRLSSIKEDEPIKGNTVPSSSASPIRMEDVRNGAVALKKALSVGKRWRSVPEEWIRVVWLAYGAMQVGRAESDKLFAKAARHFKFFPAPVEFLELRVGLPHRRISSGAKLPSHTSLLTEESATLPEPVDPAEFSRLHEFLRGKGKIDA